MRETESTAADSKRRHTMTGVVIDSPMDKTAIVAVEKPMIHQLYQRRFKRTAKFYAHDPENETRAGDRVLLVATRPLSKTKRWRVEEILERGEEI